MAQGMESHADDEQSDCYRCHGRHAPSVCHFKQEKCRSCGKIGRASSYSSRSHIVKMEAAERVFSMYNMQDANAKVKSITTALQINGENVNSGGHSWTPGAATP